MKLYRYKSDTWSLFDFEGLFLSANNPKILLQEYLVIRETKKTYIILVEGKEKRVMKFAKSTYAYESKEKALYNYKRRCASNLSHCSRAKKIAEIFYKNSINLTIKDIQK